MAIDFKDESEELDDELEYAELNYSEKDGVETVTDSMFTDADDYVVSEIRKNAKFNQLFERAIETKDSIIEERKERFGLGNSEASEVIINGTAKLVEEKVKLESVIGKEIERVDYFTYRIDGIEYSSEDLDLINTTREEYNNHVEDAIKMKRDVKHIEKELRRIKLANTLFFRRRYTYKSDEYQLNCFKVNKTDKLNENEEFLKKCDFLSSLPIEEYIQLKGFFKKSEAIGEAVDVLENNGKAKKELESREGQVELLKEVFEKNVSSEEYAELVEFIKATRERAKSKDYDTSKVEVDNSESGKLIRAFVNDIERKRKDFKSVDEMLRKFSEMNKEAKKEELEIPSVEFERDEESETPDEEIEAEEAELEQVDEVEDEETELEQVDEVEDEETELEQENPEVDIENNMIVTLVLESGKFKKIIEVIREKEKSIYDAKRTDISHAIDRKMKSSRLAAKYVEREKVELAGLLESPIKVEEDGCLIKDLFIRPEDLYLATLKDEEYANLLDKLDQIKKDKRAVEKDIRINRREARKSGTGAYLADIALNQMLEEKEAIIMAKENTEAEIAFAEFFGKLSEEKLHRTVLFISAIGEMKNSKAQAEELKEQLIELEEEQDEYRKPVMRQALVSSVKNGAVSKEQHQELVNYIRGYQKGFEDGTYRVIADYERDDSTLGQVVYDYIDLINENIEKIKAKEGQQDQPQPKTNKEQDDDGDIDI